MARPCLTLLLAGSAQAEPLVVGYERFHSENVSIAGGAVLFSELGCANCHGGSPTAVPRQGPVLTDLSSRVNRSWVEAFLADPEAGRAGSNMPAFFHGMSGEDRSAVVDYLGTLGKGFTPKSGRYVNAESGSAIYHEKGCVACHAPSGETDLADTEEFDDSLAIAFPDLKAKTSLAALADFLSNTSKYRPDGRMPHFGVEGEQALDLAAHLLDFQSSEPEEAKAVLPWPKADPATVQHGREIVQRMNCVACHDLPGIEKAGAVPISPTEKGPGHCLTANPRAGLPRYALTEKQTASLEAYLAEQAKVPPVETTLAAMNCYACHDRDGIGGPTPATNPWFHGEEALGDSGRLPPPLTDIGFKLRGDWMERVFAGDPATRVRDYLRTEMPAYAAHARVLTKLFSEGDAQPDAVPLSSEGNDLEAGRKLLGIEGGTNCITCHDWDGTPSLGIPALDIASLDQRLRPEWFRSYLLNPASYRPGTLMPPLWPGGLSTVPDVLGGDAEKQIAAIWHFIAEGEGAPAGFPDRSGGQFELVPTERPIIQRTFLEGAGTKAILVGFPAGIHLAYDGKAGRPALVWRGAFFDAYTTWFVRAAPIEKPLGEDIRPFADPGGERRYRGYELDGEGNPTFIATEGGREIRDRFVADEAALLRTVTWTGGEAPSLGHPEGLTVVDESVGNTLTFRYTFP